MSNLTSPSIRLGLLYLRGGNREDHDQAALARLMSVSLCERLQRGAEVWARVLELTTVRAGQQGRVIPDLRMPVAQVHRLVQATLAAHPGMCLDFVLYGQVEIAERLSLTVRLLRLHDETVVYEGTLAGERSALFEILGRLGEELLGTLGVPLSPEARQQLRTPETGSFEAFLCCARALDHLTPAATQAGLDPAGAVRHLMEAVRRDPHFERPYRLARRYALNCLERGEYSAGAELLRQLLQWRPGDYESQALLGHCLLHQGGLREGQQYFDRSLEIRPNVPAWVGLAIFYERIGETDLALDCYSRAQALETLPRDTRERWADLLAQAGRLEEAIALWRDLLREDPTDIRIYLRLAQAHQQQEELDQARWCYERALGLVPTSWEALYGLAQLRWQAQEYGPALELYRRAAALQPDQALLQYDLGLALLQEGHFEEAGIALRKALECGLPQEPRARAREHLSNLGKARFRAEIEADLTCRRCADLIAEGRFREAVAGLQQVVQTLPDHTSAWYSLGLAYQGLQRLEEAAAALRRVLAVEPDQADAHSDLSLVLLQRGETEKAYQHALQAYRKRPGDPEILRNFGLACLFVGRRKEGRWWLNLARHLDPQDAITRTCWEVLRQLEMV